jgi:hypothetical protein
MKKYWSRHNICTEYIQSANSTCDELIKKACHQNINRIVFTYLPNGWIKLQLIYIIFDDIYDYKPSHGCSHICHVLA